MTWDDFIFNITSEKLNRSKIPKTRKGPLMSNRRENRNTRKARNFQFTQKAFE